MALVLLDRVKETTATGGTGTFTLDGTSLGFQSFAVIGNGNTTYYSVVDSTTGEWEVGIGTYNAGTLTRDTVLSSSNSGSKVPFATNSKDIFVAYPAEKAVTLDTPQTLTDKTFVDADLGTPTAGVLTNATGLPLTTGVTGTLPVGNGGTGATTLTGYVKASGTSAFTAVASIPAGDITGLGSMATQNANSVAITGGSINGTTIGASGASTGAFTAVDVDNLNLNGNTLSSTNTNGNVVLDPNGSGSVDVSSAKIVNLATPVSGTDAATKQYVDTLVGTGIHVHSPVRLITPATSGRDDTYNNGSSGVGATLTAVGNGALSVDGVAADNGDRVIIQDQDTQYKNGVYVVTDKGSAGTPWVLTRSSDADTYAEQTSTALDEGSYFYVTSGQTLAGTSFVCTTPGVITFGSTAITFGEFSQTTVYTAGNGLTLTNLVFSLTTPVAIANGGTAITSAPANGEVLIGNGTGYTLATLTAGSGISVTNGAGSITIAATGGGGGEAYAWFIS